MEDRIVRAISSDGMVQAAAIYSRNLTERARQIHKTLPVATAALGRALAGASMMLLRGKYRQQAAALAELAETVDLSASPVFRENYVECMGFEAP